MKTYVYQKRILHLSVSGNNVYLYNFFILNNRNYFMEQ